jgi:acetolactate synthase-1/3 small subunit
MRMCVTPAPSGFRPDVFVDLSGCPKPLLETAAWQPHRKAGKAMEHIVSVLVENRFGVLAHIAGLFSVRGFNIDSLAVGETLDPTVSRMTIVARGDDKVLEQILKQLNRQVDVIEVCDLTRERSIERELFLLKVATTAKTRSEVVEVADIFRAKIVDVCHDSLTIEAIGSADKLAAFLDLLKPYGIKELVRTGRIGIARG